MTLGERIDALTAADMVTFRRILRDVLRSEETIRDRLHGDPRSPDAMARAEILERVLR